MKQLYLTIGISGSGKSTYLKKHFKPEVIVNPDSIRKELAGDTSDHTMEAVVWATATKRIKDSLEKNGIAVLDATNVNARYRRGLLSPFKKMSDVETIALVFPSNSELSKGRIKKDVEFGIDRSRVPDDVVDKQLKDYERGYDALFQQFDKVKIVEDVINLKKLLKEQLGDVL